MNGQVLGFPHMGKWGPRNGVSQGLEYGASSSQTDPSPGRKPWGLRWPVGLIPGWTHLPQD